MHKYLFSRFFLFLYDLLRLFLIIMAMTRLGSFSLYSGDLPYLAFVSSQALFPLMSWFTFFDDEKYPAFFLLNSAGKSIHAVLSGIWIFNAVMHAEMPASYRFFMSLMLTIIIMFADILSIPGMFFIKKGLERAKQAHADSEMPAENPETGNKNGGM